VEAKEVEWLWEPYLPMGMLTVMSGDPGSGKTYLSLAIAAALSNGRVPESGKACEPVNTLHISTENSPEYVVRPRFDLLGGNADRFYSLTGSFSLTDSGTLMKKAAEASAKLIIIDPLQSYLGTEVHTHRGNGIRPLLDRLGSVADSLGCCILLIRHRAKKSGGRAIYSGLGSIDITGAARSELMVGSAPQERWST
jgi:RecA-family ATPase